MKNLFVLWFMALALVFLITGSAVAEEDPFLDGGINQTTSTPGGGAEDDDHPWGGEQSPAVEPYEPLPRPSRVLLTTGIVAFDQFIGAVVYTAVEIFEPERISPQATSPTSINQTSVKTTAVASNYRFDTKKGVTR